MRAPILYLAITAMALVLPGCGGGGGGGGDGGGGGGSDTDDTGDRAEDGLTLTRIDTNGIGESADRDAIDGPNNPAIHSNDTGDVLVRWQSSGGGQGQIVWFNVDHGEGFGPPVEWLRLTDVDAGEARIVGIDTLGSALDDGGAAALVFSAGVTAPLVRLIAGQGLVSDTPVRRIDLGASPAQPIPPSPGRGDAGATALSAYRFGLTEPGLQAVEFTAGVGWTQEEIPLLTAQEQADDPDLTLIPSAPRIVELGGGTRLAVWEAADIRYNVRPPGGEWSAARILPVPGDEGQVTREAVQDLTASAAGNAVLTYTVSPAGGSDALLAAVFDGSQFLAPEVINSAAAGGRTVMDDAGNAIITVGHRTVRYDQGQFGEPRTVAPAGTDILVEVNGAGDAVALWENARDPRGFGQDLIFARSATRAEPAWSARGVIVDEDDGDLIVDGTAGLIDAAVDSAGNARVLWGQGNADFEGEPDSILWVTAAPLSAVPDLAERE